MAELTSGPRPSYTTLSDATTWQPATVRRYGKKATVTLAASTCLWYHVHRARPVQVVLVREHGHQRGFDLALVSTDLKATPAELVERYAARWAIEVTFLESKHLVGVGQARNRHRLAVQRTVPFGLCCHSLLVVWYTLHGHAAGDVATRRALAPWYRHGTPRPRWTCWWHSAARCWPNITTLTQLSPPAPNSPTRC